MSHGPRLILLCIVLAAGVQPAKSDTIFTGSGSPLGVLYIANGAIFNWDFSNIVVSDTPDGLKMSGSMSGTTSGGPANTVGIVQLSTFRPLTDPTLTDLVLKASLTATIAKTGAFDVYWGAAETYVSNVGGTILPGCDVIVNAGGDQTSDSLTGAISAGPTTSLCDPNVDSLFLNSVGYIGFTVPTSAATLTVNFGNSILGEATLAPTASPVPEPSTTGSLFVLGLGALALRKMRIIV